MDLSRLTDYSNPSIVERNAKALYGPAVQLQRSTAKDKKYMILTPKGWVHFGQLGYEDFTKHQDPRRRTLFRSRMKRFKNADKWTAGYMSYHLLW